MFLGGTSRWKLLLTLGKVLREACTYSQVKVLPAMKQAKTSSLPIIPTVPTMNSFPEVQSQISAR